MPPIVLLGAVILVPIILLTVLRVNATLVFLSLCLGSVLMQFLGPDSGTLLSLFSAHTAHTVNASQTTAKLVLLALPVVVTTICMLRSVPKGLKQALNVVPAAGVGLLGALLAMPLLPAQSVSTVTTSALWQQVLRAQDLIVGISALLCLLALFGLRPKHGGGEAKHGKGGKE